MIQYEVVKPVIMKKLEEGTRIEVKEEKAKEFDKFTELKRVENKSKASPKNKVTEEGKL